MFYVHSRWLIIWITFLDPYVKIYLLFNNQRIAKKKTHVKKRTLNPVFNESFVFDLPKSEDGLASIQLEFMLLDWDRVTKNEVGWCVVMLLCVLPFVLLWVPASMLERVPACVLE